MAGILPGCGSTAISIESVTFARRRIGQPLQFKNLDFGNGKTRSGGSSGTNGSFVVGTRKLPPSEIIRARMTPNSYGEPASGAGGVSTAASSVVAEGVGGDDLGHSTAKLNS
jgi:hypothetical protein